MLTSSKLMQGVLLFFKKLTKGNSLLVKVNKKFLKKKMKSVVSITILMFLSRMHLAQGLKHFLSKFVIEKQKNIPGLQDLKNL